MSRHGFPPPAPLGVLPQFVAQLSRDEPLHAMHLAALGHALRPLFEAVEKRRRNRRGGDQDPDSSSVICLRQHPLDADPHLSRLARFAGGLLEQRMQPAAFVEMMERTKDPGANDDTTGQRVEKELARRERARKERADAVLEARPPDASADNPRETLLQLDLLSGALMFAADFLGRMVATGNGWEAFAWLVDGLWPLMRRLGRCANQYYDIPETVHREDAIQGALALSMVVAVVRTSPEALRNADMGVPLAHLVIPYFTQVFTETLAIVLHATSGNSPLWHPVEDIGHRGRFLKAFEREWERVLPFTDGRFGFAVVPRLSVDAMRRYLDTVSWSAGGLRGAIRREVADYLVHRGLGIGEAIRAQLPGLWQDRVWSVLAPVMGLTDDRIETIVSQQDIDLDGELRRLRGEYRKRNEEFKGLTRLRLDGELTAEEFHAQPTPSGLSATIA